MPVYSRQDSQVEAKAALETAHNLTVALGRDASRSGGDRVGDASVNDYRGLDMRAPTSTPAPIYLQKLPLATNRVTTHELPILFWKMKIPRKGRTHGRRMIHRFGWQFPN